MIIPMTRRRFGATIGLIVLALSMSITEQAQAGSLLGIAPFGTLYDVNPGTGAATNPRSTGINAVVGIAYAGGTTLYGLTTGGDSAAPNSLYSIDMITGSSTLIGSTGLTFISEGDLAIDPTTGVLYGITNIDIANSAFEMFTIDTNTGAASVINPVTPNGDFSAMGFDDAGNLFIIDTFRSELLRVNKSNASVLSRTALTIDIGEVAGMAYDSITGTFFVADGKVVPDSIGQNRLYQLNISTGEMTLIGDLGIDQGLSGLTMIPEPSTLALSALGMLVVAGSIWRRRARMGRALTA